MIRSITFDAARTLVRAKSLERDWRGLSKYLVSHGIELYPQELEAARDYVFFVDLPRNHIDNWFDWCSQILYRLGFFNVDPDIVEGVIAILKPVSDGFSLYNDVLPMFELLQKYKLTYSVLTSIPEFKLKEVFQPIYPYLSQITHGGNSGYVKGNPKMYQIDLNRKKVKAEENLFIGDNSYLDIEIPQSLGQMTIYIEREELKYTTTSADFEISSLLELPDIIDQIVQK